MKELPGGEQKKNPTPEEKEMVLPWVGPLDAGNLRQETEAAKKENAAPQEGVLPWVGPVEQVTEKEKNQKSAPEEGGGEEPANEETAPPSEEGREQVPETLEDWAARTVLEDMAQSLIDGKISLLKEVLAKGGGREALLEAFITGHLDTGDPDLRVFIEDAGYETDEEIRTGIEEFIAALGERKEELITLSRTSSRPYEEFINLAEESVDLLLSPNERKKIIDAMGSKWAGAVAQEVSDQLKEEFARPRVTTEEERAATQAIKWIRKGKQRRKKQRDEEGVSAWETATLSKKAVQKVIQKELGDYAEDQRMREFITQFTEHPEKFADFLNKLPPGRAEEFRAAFDEYAKEEAERKKQREEIKRLRALAREKTEEISELWGKENATGITAALEKILGNTEKIPLLKADTRQTIELLLKKIGELTQFERQISRLRHTPAGGERKTDETPYKLKDFVAPYKIRRGGQEQDLWPEKQGSTAPLAEWERKHPMRIAAFDAETAGREHANELLRKAQLEMVEDAEKKIESSILGRDSKFSQDNAQSIFLVLEILGRIKKQLEKKPLPTPIVKNGLKEARKLLYVISNGPGEMRWKNIWSKPTEADHETPPKKSKKKGKKGKKGADEQKGGEKKQRGKK